MHIASSTLSLTVADVPSSSEFLATHFGFTEQMSADGFAALAHDTAGLSLVFLRRGIEVLPPALREKVAAGTIVAFVVDDLVAEEQRLRAAGVEVVLPTGEGPRGERLLLVTDPNGVVYELVEWAR